MTKPGKHVARCQHIIAENGRRCALPKGHRGDHDKNPPIDLIVIGSDRLMRRS